MKKSYYATPKLLKKEKAKASEKTCCGEFHSCDLFKHSRNQ